MTTIRNSITNAQTQLVTHGARLLYQCTLDLYIGAPGAVLAVERTASGVRAYAQGKTYTIDSARIDELIAALVTAMHAGIRPGDHAKIGALIDAAITASDGATSEPVTETIARAPEPVALSASALYTALDSAHAQLRAKAAALGAPHKQP